MAFRIHGLRALFADRRRKATWESARRPRHRHCGACRSKLTDDEKDFDEVEVFEFEDEPNVPEELMELDNVMLAPHIASGTRETRNAMSEPVFTNLRASPARRLYEGEVMKRPVRILTFRALAAAALFTVTGAHAELFVSVQDGKQMLIDGVVKTVDGEDTLALVDLIDGKLSLRSEIPVPASVIGPPTSVAVTSDGTLALVTAGFKRDPMDPAKTIQDDRLSVVDLSAQPPRVIDTLRVGKGPAGVSITRDGTLALVANHDDGTVSVLTIAGTKVTVADQVSLGDVKAGPMHVAITPDGRRGLVSRDGDHRVTVLAIDGNKVTATKRDLYPGQRPDCIDIRAKGDLAVVANIGKGQGDSDTVSLIDLSIEPPRVIDTVSVGQTPESVFFAPDGLHVGVNVIDGSNKPSSSPFFNRNGQFVLVRVEGKKLVKVASTPIGTWSQGMSFSADGRYVLVQNTAEKQLQLIGVEGEQLKDTGQRLQFNAAPSALRPTGR